MLPLLVRRFTRLDFWNQRGRVRGQGDHRGGQGQGLEGVLHHGGRGAREGGSVGGGKRLGAPERRSLGFARAGRWSAERIAPFQFELLLCFFNSLNCLILSLPLSYLASPPFPAASLSFSGPA